MNSGIVRSRDDDVDDVVRAVRLRQPERLLACLDELRGRVRRQHVHVESRRGRPSELCHCLDILFEPVFVVALHAHDEVRQRGFLDVVGDAEVELVVGSDRRHREDVDVLEDGRSEAAGDHLRHRGRDVVERRERREHGRAVRRTRGRASASPRSRAPSVPSEPMTSCVRS